MFMDLMMLEPLPTSTVRNTAVSDEAREKVTAATAPGGMKKPSGHAVAPAAKSYSGIQSHGIQSHGIQSSAPSVQPRAAVQPSAAAFAMVAAAQNAGASITQAPQTTITAPIAAQRFPQSVSALNAAGYPVVTAWPYSGTPLQQPQTAFQGNYVRPQYQPQTGSSSINVYPSTTVQNMTHPSLTTTYTTSSSLQAPLGMQYPVQVRQKLPSHNPSVSSTFTAATTKPIAHRVTVPTAIPTSSSISQVWQNTYNQTVRSTSSAAQTLSSSMPLPSISGTGITTGIPATSVASSPVPRSVHPQVNYNQAAYTTQTAQSPQGVARYPIRQLSPTPGLSASVQSPQVVSHAAHRVGGRIGGWPMQVPGNAGQSPIRIVQAVVR